MNGVVIACSKAKHSGGEGFTWIGARKQQGMNQFPLFDKYRRELAEYFSQDGRVGNAKGDEINRNVFTSCTMPALLRYDGLIYKQIRDVIGMIFSGYSNRFFILSTMWGVLAPKDLIPNYELTLDDQFRGEKVSEYWMELSKNCMCGGTAKEYYDQFKKIYFFCGVDYFNIFSGFFDSAKCVHVAVQRPLRGFQCEIKRGQALLEIIGQNDLSSDAIEHTVEKNRLKLVTAG